MLELPEALHLADQLNASVAGQTVEGVLPPSKAHKFCWYSGDPADYNACLRGWRIVSAAGFGIFAEIAFANGLRLSFNDGVNVRLVQREAAAKDYQLMLLLERGQALVFTVAMYGGILLHDGSYDDAYYCSSKAAASPLSADFPAVYRERLNACKPTLSAKAFLATEQRFPGIGNGVLQDILLAAGIHPKRKLSTFEATDHDRLLVSTVAVVGDMIARGGRDTEKDLFGNPGGYRVRMSKNTLAQGCPVCGGPVTKEAYLGGSVYYCPRCQPL